MALFSCPYLQAEVELSDDREAHITAQHPDLLPEHKEKMIETVLAPDQIRRSARFGDARLFTRWFDDVRDGKHVVVVVITDAAPNERHWIVTAYITRRLTQGEVEWTRN